MAKKPKRTMKPQVQPGKFSTLPTMKGLADLVREATSPVDKLPGEWVKLPPMKWPETLPVEVPTVWSGMNQKSILSSRCFEDVDAWGVAFGLFHAVLAKRDPTSLTQMQSAWSETLVRLGYTEDA